MFNARGGESESRMASFWPDPPPRLTVHSETVEHLREWQSIGQFNHELGGCASCARVSERNG